ncbi:MAG: M1 family metallopeptidase [Gemmatimonadetes bacterium]|nr:M1 family metallopeptidase [Gemmatimonadota bacterium]
MNPRRSTHPRVVHMAVFAVALLFFLPGSTEAQEDGPGWKVRSPFRPLDLATPNTIRTGAGLPGPDYWQQKVDYRIEAALDPSTNVLEGSETIRYRNNSPHALSVVWLKLDANLCDPDSKSHVLAVPPLLFGESVFDFTCDGYGMTLDRVAAGDRDLEHEVMGTIARVELPHPLPAGARTEIEIDWTTALPEYGYGRTGRDGTLYQVAQWYPRVAVYDDVSGWNLTPFLGAGEFYQEFGDFQVALTVPDNFVMTATGTIVNPDAVLTEEQQSRLERADASEEAVAVITQSEARSNRDRRASGTKTWRFAAENVRDFAFAMAPDFRWDASSWDGVRIQTFYRPEAELWEEANRMSWVSIKHFSERLFPYPWPHATTVEGPNDGMEYPMITFVPTETTREALYWVLTHEFGHEWYPMIVNSNERLHPWMDEGFNTFIDIESVEVYFEGDPYADAISVQPLELWAEHSIGGREQAMALPPDEQHDLFWAGYFKPALMLHLLQYEVLGKERFDRAFSEYTHAWAFKHPTASDFIRAMANSAGMDLDWFWRGWVYSTARLDQAVTGVSVTEAGVTEIRIESLGEMIMPAELAIDFADGSTEVVRLPIEMWKLGPVYTYRVPAGREVSGVTLDPRAVYPDDDRANNERAP